MDYIGQNCYIYTNISLTKIIMELRSVRGMRDIVPEDQKYWSFISQSFSNIAESLGFKKLDLPLLEETALFKRSIGEGTDIVEKELFEIKPKSDDAKSLALRPELTAGCVRAYSENGFRSLSQPVKLYLNGPVYRYDRPQKNRYREFYQLDLEIIGDLSAKYDFLIIQTTINLLSSVGLTELSLSINSIGCKDCRIKFRDKLLSYFNDHINDYCEDCRTRAEMNPLRVLDCKEEKCRVISSKAPKTTDHLCKDCQHHFDELKALFGSFEIKYSVDPLLVRGLDYYNRTVFEVNLKNDLGRQSSLAGGGRYDNLFETLGEKPTPAVGVALGLDRVVNALIDNKIEVPEIPGVSIMILGVGETQKECLDIYNNLRNLGCTPYFLPSADNLSKQLEQANRLKTHFAIIIGEDEAKSGHYQLKDLETGEQVEVSQEELLEQLT